jgi:hypothetical protein
MKKLLAVSLSIVACLALVYCGLQFRDIFRELQKPQKIEVSVSQKGGKQILPREYSCKLAIVEWADAVIRIRASDEFEGALKNNTPLLSHAIAIGCVIERKDMNEIIVVSGFSEGKPDDFVTIPGPWVRKITYLEPKKGGKRR